MNIVLSFSEINWLSVLVAAISAFAVGSLWYSPVTPTGKTWMKIERAGKEQTKSANMPLIFITAFVLNFIAAIVLDMFIGTNGTLISGIITGALAGVAFVSTSFGVNYLFALRSFKLFLVDAGYNILFFLVTGAILGAW